MTTPSVTHLVGIPSSRVSPSVLGPFHTPPCFFETTPTSHGEEKRSRIRTVRVNEQKKTYNKGPKMVKNQ